MKVGNGLPFSLTIQQSINFSYVVFLNMAMVLSLIAFVLNALTLFFPFLYISPFTDRSFQKQWLFLIGLSNTKWKKCCLNVSSHLWEASEALCSIYNMATLETKI